MSLALSELTTDVDYEAWNALRPFLNQYEFAGYVNDDKITVFQWLQKNIIAYLPIHVINGPNGLKPVLDMFQGMVSIRERLSVTAGTDFERAGPVVSLNTPEDVSNVITVRYAVNGVVDDYSTFVQISNRIPASGNLSSISYSPSQIHGFHPKIWGEEEGGRAGLLLLESYSATNSPRHFGAGSASHKIRSI